MYSEYFFMSQIGVLFLSNCSITMVKVFQFLLEEG